MAMDALRGYLALAGGLTDVTRQRAVAQAKALLADGALDPVVDATREAGNQVQALADDIVATSRANRDLLVGIVRSEAERVVGSLGLAGSDEVAALQAQVDRLIRRVTALEAPHAAAKTAKRAPAKTAKRAPAKKATASAATPATAHPPVGDA